MLDLLLRLVRPKPLSPLPPPQPSAGIRVAVQPVQPAAGVPAMPPVQDDDDPLRDVPRYPPFDAGIPVKPIDMVLASQSELIGRIFRTAGVSREEFDKFYQPAIRNLARHVHLLPATDTENHQGAGGLFCFALEIGLYSLQMANASVFPVGGGVERRFHMTPKWSLATFLAGICSQLYRTVGTMVVLTREHEQWQPLLMPIYDWSVSANSDRYFIRWLEDRNQSGAQASSAYVVNLIVPVSVMQHLAIDNNLVLPAMSAAITGGSSGDNPILKIINPITSRVIMEDRKRSVRNYGHMTVGTHLEPHLLDAMIRLIRGGTWSWNNRNAVIWIGSDGVFISWTDAAQAVVNLMTRDGYAGIPRDPDTLADMLTGCGVFEAPKKGGKYWTITPPDVSGVIDTAVKLTNPQQVFPAGFDFAPLAAVTLGMSAATPTAPAKAVPAGAQNRKASTPASAAPQPSTPPTTTATNTETVPAERPVPEMPARETAPAAVPVTPEPPPLAAHSGEHDIEIDTATGEILRAEPPGYVASPPPPAAPPPAKNTASLEKPSGQGSQGSQGKSNQRKPGSGGEPKAQTREQPRPPASPATGKSNAPSPTKPTSPSSEDEPVLPGPAAERLLAMIKPENARLLKDIFRGYQKGKLTGVIGSLPQGLGISHEELVGHGRPAMEFIQELAERQWLWVDKTKPTRSLHLLEHNGKQHRFIVLKPDIATGLGFTYEAP